MRLYLVRHPPPQIAAATCYGSSDIAAGAHDHAEAVARLRLLLPAGAPVFSSPLIRCAGLAAPLAAALGNAVPRFDARLAEMDFGAWERRSWDRIARAEIDAWCADPLDYRPGGGETVLEMAQRVLAFRGDLVRRGLPQAVVVCHAGTIRILEAAACRDGLHAIARHAYAQAAAIGYGQLHVLDLA